MGRELLRAGGLPQQRVNRGVSRQVCAVDVGDLGSNNHHEHSS